MQCRRYLRTLSLNRRIRVQTEDSWPGAPPIAHDLSKGSLGRQGNETHPGSRKPTLTQQETSYLGKKLPKKVRGVSIRNWLVSELKKDHLSRSLGSLFWSRLFLFAKLCPRHDFFSEHYPILFELAKNAPADSQRARSLRIRKIGQAIYKWNSVRLDIINETEYLDAYVSLGLGHQAVPIWKSRDLATDPTDIPYWLQVGALFYIDNGLWRTAELLSQLIERQFGAENITGRLLTRLIGSSTGRVRHKRLAIGADFQRCDRHWLDLLESKLSSEGLKPRDIYADPRLYVPTAPSELKEALRECAAQGDWFSISRLIHFLPAEERRDTLTLCVLCAPRDEETMAAAIKVIESSELNNTLTHAFVLYLANDRESSLKVLDRHQIGKPVGGYMDTVSRKLMKAVAMQRDFDYLGKMKLRIANTRMDDVAIKTLLKIGCKKEAARYFDDVVAPSAMACKAIVQDANALIHTRDIAISKLLELPDSTGCWLILCKHIVDKTIEISDQTASILIVFIAQSCAHKAWSTQLQIACLNVALGRGDISGAVGVLAHLTARMTVPQEAFELFWSYFEPSGLAADELTNLVAVALAVSDAERAVMVAEAMDSAAGDNKSGGARLRYIYNRAALSRSKGTCKHS